MVPLRSLCSRGMIRVLLCLLFWIGDLVSLPIDVGEFEVAEFFVADAGLC